MTRLKSIVRNGIAAVTASIPALAFAQGFEKVNEAVTKRIQTNAGTNATTTASATHQLTSVPPHMISSMPVPKSTTSGTSGTPSFMAGRVAPL